MRLSGPAAVERRRLRRTAADSTDASAVTCDRPEAHPHRRRYSGDSAQVSPASASSSGVCRWKCCKHVVAAPVLVLHGVQRRQVVAEAPGHQPVSLLRRQFVDAAHRLAALPFLRRRVGRRTEPASFTGRASAAAPGRPDAASATPPAAPRGWCRRRRPPPTRPGRTARPSPPTRTPPSSLDELINTELTAATRPRISSGVSVCISVPRTTTLTLSSAPVTRQHDERQPEIARKAEYDRRRPEAGHRQQQRPPRPAQRRPVRQPHRHDDGAEGRRGPQPAESHGADVEDVLGVDRQQGRRPAQQHREQVERDGGQQQLRPPDEAARPPTATPATGPGRGGRRLAAAGRGPATRRRPASKRRPGRRRSPPARP